MNKQNLWFLTLFSLILILGVYYVTIPEDLLEKANKISNTKQTNAEVKEVIEENTLTAMRVNKEEERDTKKKELKKQLTDEKLTTQEKNNVYEELKYLNEVQSKEEELEKSIKKEYKLDCFIKMNNSNVEIICISNEHDKTLANNLMRSVQKNYKDPLNITVKFQKK